MEYNSTPIIIFYILISEFYKKIVSIAHRLKMPIIVLFSFYLMQQIVYLIYELIKNRGLPSPAQGPTPVGTPTAPYPVVADNTTSSDNSSLSALFDFFINYGGPSALLSVLTAYLYFIVACYYYPTSRNFINYKAFLFFTITGELSLLFTFLTNNFFVFYTLFEFILIPFFFIVLTWGSRLNRITAAFRLVFFTLVFSTPLTIIVAANLYGNYFSFDFGILGSSIATTSITLQTFFYVSCFLAFAVKIPLFPAHVWLPEAHGEAPTFGSVLLAGVLLKLGGYGFYRVFFDFIDPNWLSNNISLFSMIYTVSVVTIIYSNIVVFGQLDIKRTIAYYSIGHMGFVTLGFATSLIEGSVGANLIILGHGLSAAGLFFCVGYLYEQSHTRSLLAYRGVATTIPYFAIIFFLFICANVSLPGSLNFIGEQIVLISLAKFDTTLVVLPIIGVLINGLSSFLFLIRISFGEAEQTAVLIRDINSLQIVLLGLLFLPIVVFGFLPNNIVQILIHN